MARAPPAPRLMGGAWLLKRFVYLAVVAAAPTGLADGLLRGWHRVAEFLNGAWPPWVNNVANVFQIVGPIVAFLAA